MNGEICTKWNYQFQWTENHLAPQELNPLRYEYDKLGAAALEKLQRISARDVNKEDLDGKRRQLDLYSLLRDNHESDGVLHEFWNELHSVPDWVDWEQLARGQKVFYRYAAANLTGFALQGFVGENSVCCLLSSHMISRRYPLTSRTGCYRRSRGSCSYRRILHQSAPSSSNGDIPMAASGDA